MCTLQEISALLATQLFIFFTRPLAISFMCCEFELEARSASLLYVHKHTHPHLSHKKLSLVTKSRDKTTHGKVQNTHTHTNAHTLNFLLTHWRVTSPSLWQVEKLGLEVLVCQMVAHKEQPSTLVSCLPCWSRLAWTGLFWLLLSGSPPTHH